MNKRWKPSVSVPGNLLKILAIMLCCISCSLYSFASHLFGGELFYTHISGTTYRVTMILYGDCGGSQAAFDGLITATPQVEVYNGNSFMQTLSLQPQSGSGINVSPVCPDEVNNTTCSPNGTLPGVKKFIYYTNVTLNTVSGSWKFRFNGQFQNNTQAGRSNSITNIFIGVGGSLMSLEATLNNIMGVNSSPTYTTIPTPFFCINKPQEYNQGAVDANGDSLVFALVPGLDASSNPSILVNYISPFTATAPLASAPGTFNFNNTNGQLSFYPNQAQNALVVGKVSEYRNGVLVGSSMREMTFVVLSTCNNNPPDGDIVNPVNGTVSGNTFTTCKENYTIAFGINNTDLDGDNVNLIVQGAPAGAVVNITGNNTPSPQLSFSWNLATVPAGVYTFYLDYTDDGCPLASKQTVAYTINVVPKPIFSYTLITPATCNTKAVFSIAPSPLANAPYTLNVQQGTSNVLTVNNISSVATDSLSAGTYTFRITNSGGCFKDSVITIVPPSNIQVQFSWLPPDCPLGNNGSITVTATGTNPPFEYAINSGVFGATNVFTGLQAGTYVVKVKDATTCIKDSAIVVTDPPGMHFATLIKKPVCSPIADGQITLTAASGHPPYQYAIGAGAYAATNTFGGLPAGSYTFHAKDASNCIKDTVIVLTDSLVMQLQATVTPVQCFGTATGMVILNPSGTTSPYAFALGSSTFGAGNSFPGLPIGTYQFHIKDQNQCTKDTTVTITQPTPLAFNLVLHQVPCFGTNGGSVVVAGQGGVANYTYSADGNPYQVGPQLHNLGAGQHTIRMRDNNNCIKDTVIVLTQPPTAVAFGPIDITLPTCEGFFDGSVNLSGQGGVGAHTFGHPGNVFNDISLFDSLADGSYIFKVKDANGCIQDTIITLTGYPHIVIDEVLLRDATCWNVANGSITLSASGGLPPFSYGLSDAGNWRAVPVFDNVGAGSHTIMVRDQHACIKDTTITLSQPAELIVDTLSIGADCNGVDNGGYINVFAEGGTEPYSFAWLQDASNNNTSIRGLRNGTYNVTVTDANGCKDSAAIAIFYTECCMPHIPNAFTPNADGKNDQYQVLYKTDMNLVELSIYNRAGQRVFSSADVSRTWDGYFDGKPCDIGTYYYYLRILCGSSVKEELIYKGDITLIR